MGGGPHTEKWLSGNALKCTAVSSTAYRLQGYGIESGRVRNWVQVRTVKIGIERPDNGCVLEQAMRWTDQWVIRLRVVLNAQWSASVILDAMATLSDCHSLIVRLDIGLGRSEPRMDADAYYWMGRDAG